MDTKKSYKSAISSKLKAQPLKPSQKSPGNRLTLLGALLILAAIVILVLTLLPKQGKQKGGSIYQVPYDIRAVREEQESVDDGHSPWKLDPVFVTQVFVSLKISPNGIQGDYPVKKEELKLIEASNKEAVVQVNSSRTQIRFVYLKRLVRKDDTGIWTVTAYEIADANKAPENVPESTIAPQKEEKKDKPETQEKPENKENIENKENKENIDNKSNSEQNKG